MNGESLTDADSVEVYQVCQFLALLHISLLPLIDPHTDEVRVHKLSADRAQHLTAAVLHESQLTGIEDHAHLITQIQPMYSTKEKKRKKQQQEESHRKFIKYSLSYILILAVELLVASRSLPVDFTELAGVEVANEQSASGVSHQISVVTHDLHTLNLKQKTTTIYTRLSKLNTHPNYPTLKQNVLHIPGMT